MGIAVDVMGIAVDVMGIVVGVRGIDVDVMGIDVGVAGTRGPPVDVHDAGARLLRCVRNGWRRRGQIRCR
eukprot:3071728-Pyramimonas_sp.AAC.1